MTSMDDQIQSAEDASPELVPSVEPKITIHSFPNRHDSKSVANDMRKSNTIQIVRKNFRQVLWYLIHNRLFLFILFTCIAMAIGIMTVCFTSPKQPGKTCLLLLRSEAHSSISEDSRPHSIAVGDFNNDSLLDIVITNSGIDNIGVFLRSSIKGFANPMTYSTGSNSIPYAVAVAHLNNDQQLDIAVANFGTNNIGIFLGRDNGTFSTQTAFSTGSSRPQWIAIDDFNNDTALDIAVVNYGTNSIGILLGYNNGTFASPIISFTGYDSLPTSLAITDFNNDGHRDLAVANYGTNNVGILLGHGDGTFATQTTFNTGTNSQPISIAIGYFNNDIYPDVVVVNFGRDNVAVLLGYGNGSFTLPMEYPTGNNSLPRSVAVGDFDNDKQLDIAISDYAIPSVGILFGYGNGTFTNQLTFYTNNGSNLYLIVAGHFNHDSQLDMAGIDYDNNYIDIILTYRNYSFSSQTTYITTGLGSQPQSVAIADFNNDGRSDIAIANYWTNNFGILLGYGNGTFSAQMTYYAGDVSGPYSVAVGDFDNDSRIDIVIANYDNNNVGVFLGYGDGTFSSQSTYSTGSKSQPYAVIVGDFNKDGRSDIAVANYGTNNIGILIGYGNGTFSTQTTYSTGNGSKPDSIASNDMNNDGWLDIAVANYHTNNVGIFLGLSNGTFTTQKIYSTGSGSGPYSIAFGDFNGDRLLDIVVVNYLANNVGVLLGSGGGNLSSQVTFSTGNGSSPKSVALGDFNNDGQIDIAVANYNTDNVGIFIGYGNSSFSSQKVYSTGKGSGPLAVAVGDLNNDGRSDIVVANYGTSNAAILLGYGDNFTSPKIYSTRDPSNPYSVAVGDFNADGRLDMVAANYDADNIDVFLGYGDGTFSPQLSYSTVSGSYPHHVTIGDFNNDSRLDIAVANSHTNNIGVFIGHGDGTFSNQVTYSTGSSSYPRSVTVGDFNNDGRLDIAAANSQTNNFGIFLGYGNGTFSKQMTFSTGNGSLSYDVAVGDFNSDSRLDITVANYDLDNVGIYLGYGNGSFYTKIIYSTTSGSAPSAVIVSDLNKDSQLDIVVVLSYSYLIGVFLGYGDATFAPLVTYATGAGSQPYTLVAGDWNNDNRLDIAVANFGTFNVGVFLGKGDGTFLDQRTYSTGISSFPKSVACGDFNNDSLLDIAVANSNGSNSVGIFLGRTYMNGVREDTYSTGSSPYPRAVAVGDFNKDAQVDIAIANFGLHNVGVLFGYTNGSFSMQTQFSTGSLSFPTSVAVGYLDKDNEPDIVVAISGAQDVGVFYGYGNGSFKSLTTYSTEINSIPQSVAIGDFNNDNRSDVAVANDGTNDVNVLLRCDNGAIEQSIGYTTGVDSNPFGVAVADFNNDCWLDFAVANRAGNNVGVFLALGNGSFSNQVTYPTGSGSGPWGIAVADFNNDSQLDIVVANYGGNTIGIFLGFHNGTFMNQKTYSTGNKSNPISVAVGDFNSDSHLDIVVANTKTDNIGILLGFGDGNFAEQITYSTGSNSYPSSVSIADFNNDRQLDIAVANAKGNSIGVFLGIGNATFSIQTTYSTSTGGDSNPPAVVTGDFNNDNRMDIAVANYDSNNIGVLFGYGDGRFSAQITYPTGSGSGPWWVSTGDFNNDKQLDIAIVNIDGNTLGILLGCTNGTFFSQVTYSNGNYTRPFGLAVGDFNRDGRLDFVMTSSEANSVGLFFGYASEGFLSAPAYSTGLSSDPTSIAVGDFDKDSRLDIVVANNGTDNIMVLFGSGYGTFVSQMAYSTGNGSYPCGVAVNDFNNDSWLDVVVANSGADNIGIFLGNENGTFTSQMTYFTGVRSQPYSVAIVDIDSDTRLDIIVANYGSSSVGVFLGYGNGSFRSQLLFDTGFGSHPYALAVGDVNKDNLVDVVITNSGYGNIDILSKVC